MYMADRIIWAYVPAVARVETDNRESQGPNRVKSRSALP